VVLSGLERGLLDGEARRYLAELEDELHYEIVLHWQRASTSTASGRR
jgi:hypothetical protein